jgi:hypothetical protein
MSLTVAWTIEWDLASKNNKNYKLQYSMWNLQKYRHIDQQNKIESRNKPFDIWSDNFWQECQDIHWTICSTNDVKKTGYSHEIWHLPYATCKSLLKMDWKPKCKTQNYKIHRRKQDENFMALHLQWFLGVTPKAQATKAKEKGLHERKISCASEYTINTVRRWLGKGAGGSHL